MVFFNYATMQMAAKIVYYGPGLCGKTTNLQQIYSKTSPQSRGEMVSLETETDRTLFFDLLPIDVGVIGGFKTRLQLYTVPGQVFYNTTRKLVLKGVDGIVFVADSQMAMLDANADSYRNLRENLAEIGLELNDFPVVVQLNKRDLPNIADPETILSHIDPNRKYEYVEAVAYRGEGVFETLKLISKLTLRTLRRRMTGEETPKSAPRRVADVATFRVKEEPAAARPAAPARSPTPAFTAPAPAASPAQPAVAVVPEPEAPEEIIEELTAAAEIIEPSGAASASPYGEVADVDARILTDAPIASPPAPTALPSPPPVETPVAETPEKAAFEAKDSEPEVEFGEAEKPAKAPPVKTVKVRSSVDIMAELESLRKRATQGAVRAPRSAEPPGATKSRRDLHRTIVLQAAPEVAATSNRVRIAVSFEGENGIVQNHEQLLEVDELIDARSLSVDLKVTLS